MGMGQMTRRKRCPVSPEKTQYRSERDAAVASRNKEFWTGVPLRFYRCQWCDHWHLTSKPHDKGMKT